LARFFIHPQIFEPTHRSTLSPWPIGLHFSLPPLAPEISLPVHDRCWLVTIELEIPWNLQSFADHPFPHRRARYSLLAAFYPVVFVLVHASTALRAFINNNKRNTRYYREKLSLSLAPPLAIPQNITSIGGSWLLQLAKDSFSSSSAPPRSSLHNKNNRDPIIAVEFWWRIRQAKYTRALCSSSIKSNVRKQVIIDHSSYDTAS
jgi:hypothetical protein